ncbi:MAG: L-cysteine desulfidase family protein [Sphaerochaetaceae bacterium]
MEKSRLLCLVKQEMMLAMGCTEPGAAALAGAKARDLVSGWNQKIRKVEIFASRDIVKNAMGVGLPGCGLRGIQAAVALGICGGKVSDGLGILSNITDSDIKCAKAMNISLSLAEDVPPLYVRVRVSTSDHTGDATIRGEHDHFCSLMADGKPVTAGAGAASDETASAEEVRIQSKGSIDDCEFRNLTLQEIVRIASELSVEEGRFLMDAVDTNLKISRHGLEHDYGLCVGKVAIQSLSQSPQTLAEAFSYAAALAAAGSDARMAGCSMGVVINSGSGNQGITVTVPVYTLARFLEASDEKLVRALLISQAVGLVITARKDRLSALCGAFTAAIATACAYVYLLNGTVEAMERAINVMIGNLTGIICDGAKMTCPLKIHSSLEAAGLAARIALAGHDPGIESGICGKDSLQAIDSLSRISTEGMEETDRTILSIMLEKNC